MNKPLKSLNNYSTVLIHLRSSAIMRLQHAAVRGHDAGRGLHAQNKEEQQADLSGKAGNPRRGEEDLYA